MITFFTAKRSPIKAELRGEVVWVRIDNMWYETLPEIRMSMLPDMSNRLYMDEIKTVLFEDDNEYWRYKEDGWLSGQARLKRDKEYRESVITQYPPVEFI